MAGINAGDTLEITIEGAIFGQRTMNVLHYNVINASISATYTTAMTNLLTDYLNSATGPLLPILAAAAQNWTCQNIRGQRLWPTRDIALFKTDGRPGTRPLDATASNVSAVITKHGALATRRDVGGFHLAGLAADDYADGELTPAQKGRMAAIGARLVTTLAVAGDGTQALPCLIGSSGPAATRTIIAFGVRDEVRVMRRRTVRLGI